jgi:hypothetical protein
MQPEYFGLIVLCGILGILGFSWRWNALSTFTDILKYYYFRSQSPITDSPFDLKRKYFWGTLFLIFIWVLAAPLIYFIYFY